MTLVHWGCSLKRDKSKGSYFSLAANEGLLVLMKLLIDIDTSVLHETWVRTQSPPLSLFRKPNFCSWLWEMSRFPRSLQEECRSHIWKTLKTFQCDKVKKLPLPDKLKHYVGMMDHFPEAMYAEKDLKKAECPYDCLSTCLNVQCPVLDFSSDGEYELDITWPVNLYFI